MLIWSRIIIKKENKIIGISYMYPNETINPKHHVPKLTNNNQSKKIMEFVCSVSEIQTKYSSLDNMSLYRYRLHKIDSWDVPK